MINAIIVDENPSACQELTVLLQNHCPEVSSIISCYSAGDALQILHQHRPHLVFIDMKLLHLNGFKMLEQINPTHFCVVFTSGSETDALTAIHYGAIDYLLKPVDERELKKAVEKVLNLSQNQIEKKLEVLLEKINHPSPVITKVAMPTLEGLQMVNIESIISCESDSNYTILYLKNKQKITVSRTLKEIEELLNPHLFLRVHSSYLVNLNEISKYIKGEGGYLIMSDGTTIDVSRSKKEILLKSLLQGRK